MEREGNVVERGKWGGKVWNKSEKRKTKIEKIKNKEK